MENRLRNLREDAGFSQEDLAGQLGVSRQTVISIERGKYNPPLPLAFTIARHFGKTIEEVFLCDDAEPADTH